MPGDANQMNERRVARRYGVAVQVLVGEAGLRRVDRPRGLTRDISTSGLYFTMAQPPRPGSRVELTITLPGSLTGSSDVVVEVVGRVVRVDVGANVPADDRLEAFVGSGADFFVDAPVDPRTDAGERGASGAAVAAPVGVAAQIEKYDIISMRPAAQGSAPVF